MNALRRILVTGGSGFIGEPTVRQLVNRGFEVINFDIKMPEWEIPGVCTIQGDIVERDVIVAAVRDTAPDAIIHLAAHADITSQAWEDFRSIHRGTENLLAAVDATPQVRRLVNISTQLVIGPGYSPRSLLDFEPYTPYGHAKAYAEAVLFQWQSPVSWVTVRPTNIWGPRHPAMGAAIWKYLGDGRYLHPMGPPVLRTYGYVENTAFQLIEAMIAPDDKVTRQVLYAGDAVLDSALWVDAFARRLRGKPARRVPTGPFRMLGRVGDLINMTGIRSPIDSGRVLRMTQSYPTPIEPMLDLAGPGPVSFELGVERSVAWLTTHGVGKSAEA